VLLNNLPQLNPFLSLSISIHCPYSSFLEQVFHLNLSHNKLSLYQLANTLPVIVITIIAVIIIITITGRVFANWYRDNLLWDKFRWKTCSKKDEYGQCIDIDKDRKGLSWGKLFSNTCLNIADYAKTTKDTLLNRTSKIKAKLTTDNTVMGETFTNMVNPSQPQRFESFHNIF
jgi:hypothetical protein